MTHKSNITYKVKKYMNDKLLKLSEEKRKKIINAALEEFAMQGYNKASTDAIVNKAEISKGSLFNYFENKLNLYIYVLQYIIEISSNEILKQIKGIKEQDFYDRLKQIAIIKYEYTMSHPLEIQMLKNYTTSMLVQLPHLSECITDYQKIQETILEEYLIPYIDENKLKPGITREDILFMTYTVLEGIIRKEHEMGKVKPNKEVMNKKHSYIEVDKYIEILKYGVYKNEYNI